MKDDGVSRWVLHFYLGCHESLNTLQNEFVAYLRLEMQKNAENRHFSKSETSFRMHGFTNRIWGVMSAISEKEYNLML